MRYKSSRYMLQRRRSVVGRIARGALWLAAALLLIIGLVLVFAAPVAEVALARALAARGLGPVRLDITRLDPSGLSVRGLTALGGAARLGELDVTFDWRTLPQGRIDAVRINGLDAKLTWAQDGTISLGTLQLFPRPAAEPPPPVPPATQAAQPSPSLRVLTVENSKLTLALPSGEIALPFSLAAAQDANGRALDGRLDGQGPGVDLSAVISAVEPTGKIAQGSASISAQIKALTLPGMLSDMTGEIALNLSFDDQGARTKDTQFNLSFLPPEPLRQRVPGLQGDRPVRLSLGATNSRLLMFTLDRTLPIPRITLDAGLTLASGRIELQTQLKGWSDVPLANTSGERTDPQDFNFERLGLTARQVPVAGGAVDAALAIVDLKGPIAVAEGRVTGSLGGAAAGAERLAGVLNSGFRLDGLSLSFDLQDLWLEAENFKLGAALAQGINRAELSKDTKAAQQLNVVFSSAGTTTLTADLSLSAALPKILTDAAATAPGLATVTLPRINLNGYLAQGAEALKGQMKFSIAEGRLTHPMAGLADIAAELGYDGKALSGPVSARLLEAADPTRPKALDRRGAELKLNLMIESESIDIKGKINAGDNVNVGDFSYAQKGSTPGAVNLKIPPRTWAAAPSFIEAFGPLAALTNTTGTFGLEMAATPTAKGVVAGSVKLALADFGFSAGALSMQNLNAAVELDQVWPPRAKAPQRVFFARMLAGVPFTDGDFTLALPGDATLVMTQADVKLAGGAVTGRDLLIPLDQRDQTFVMDVTNVDLGTLVSAFATDGLAATGKLSGKLPLRMKEGALFIERGRLGGRNGNIRYAPAVPPAALAQGGGTILLQALADFKYDEVTANLNGDITKDLAVGLTLKGRNPGLYGGYPIEFNLNLDGPLNRLVREGLSGYRIPDDIKQRLEQMGVGEAGAVP